MFERVIFKRQLPFVNIADGSSERQYRFRQARSTFDVIAAVMDLIRTVVSLSGS